MKIPKLIIKPVVAVFGLILAVFLVIAGMEQIADLPKDEVINVKGDNASIPLAATVDLMVASFLLIAGKDEAAVKWFTSAAEQGLAIAQNSLGVMYYEGRGIPQDYETALKWWTRAAEQEYDSTQYNLGFMYDKGRGVPQDYTTALKWYTLAAEQGNARAQTNLGLMYRKGRGVPQDDVYAYMWFNIAASSGDKDALKHRDKVAKWMTSAQLEKAHDLAHEWLEKNTKDAE